MQKNLKRLVFSEVRAGWSRMKHLFDRKGCFTSGGWGGEAENSRLSADERESQDIARSLGSKG